MKNTKELLEESIVKTSVSFTEELMAALEPKPVKVFITLWQKVAFIASILVLVLVPILSAISLPEPRLSSYFSPMVLKLGITFFVLFSLNWVKGFWREVSFS